MRMRRRRRRSLAADVVHILQTLTDASFLLLLHMWSTRGIGSALWEEEKNKQRNTTGTETVTETEAYLEGLWRRVPNGSQEIGDGCIVEEDDRHTDRYQKKKEQASGPHSPQRRQASIPPPSSSCCRRPHSRVLPLLHGTSTSLSLCVCLLLSLKKPYKRDTRDTSIDTQYTHTHTHTQRSWADKLPMSMHSVERSKIAYAVRFLPLFLTGAESKNCSLSLSLSLCVCLCPGSSESCSGLCAYVCRLIWKTKWYSSCLAWFRGEQ